MILQRNSIEWERALDEFVLARTGQPFAWGSNDCCTFAAAWLLAVRGLDAMASLRTYEDALGAARALERAGGLLLAVTDRLGEPVPGMMAQRGDVALVHFGEGRLALGVCTGSAIAAPGEHGLVLVPMTEAEAAWRV